jgi:hypothetical protein
MYWRGLSRERDYVAKGVVLLPKPKVAGSMPVARLDLQERKLFLCQICAYDWPTGWAARFFCAL